MKKNGFTLAEVLITLTIIGVVAVLTLPALMANTAEQQARTSFKKMINTFTNAAALSQANYGIDYDTITVASGDKMTAGSLLSDVETTLLPGSLAKLIVDNTKVEYSRLVDFGTGSGWVTAPALVDRAIYLQDGTAVYFKSTDSKDITDFTSAIDARPLGIKAIFDTNGIKAPNMLSNCSGVSAQANITDWNFDDSGNCSDSNKSKRIIKDQFMVHLRGTTATPLGAAGAWILDEKVTSLGATSVYRSDGGNAPAEGPSGGDDNPETEG